MEDSPTELYVIQRALNIAPDIQVVGTATNGKEAIAALIALKPDVVCTDYHMPVMDGLEFIIQAMQIYPCPILVLSISVQANQTENVFNLLAAGALDVMAKPILPKDQTLFPDAQRLAEKIRILNLVKRPKVFKPGIPVRLPETFEKSRRIGVAAIGSSTGGPQALSHILPQLKADFPLPIVCVQHISPGFLGGMVNWLAERCVLPLTVAENGMPLQAGRIYFAPDKHHLIVDAQQRFQLQKAGGLELHCPSIDRLLLSLVEVYGGEVAGVLLSGMGRDGVEGLKAIVKAGGKTLVQDEQSCTIFGMPKAAIEAGAAQRVVPLEHIAFLLSGLAIRHSPKSYQASEAASQPNTA